MRDSVRTFAVIGVVLCLAAGVILPLLRADDPTASGRKDPLPSVAKDKVKTETGASSESGKIVPLNKEGTILVDARGKRVLLKTKVVFRDGVLEMLVCRKQTKEHESILSVDGQVYLIHAGLLAIGAEPGTPVSFNPEFKPPTGQRVDIFLQWTDDKGKLQRVAAQEWVRHGIRRYYVEPMASLPADLKMPGKESELRYDAKHKELSWYGPMTAAQRDQLSALSSDAAYKKAIATFHKKSQSRKMDAHWVFAGSGFYVDEKTGERHYQAEGGDVICVANFPDAMLDVDVQSSATGEENLLFEAWTEKIPPLGTEVTVELIPVAREKK